VDDGLRHLEEFSPAEGEKTGVSRTGSNKVDGSDPRFVSHISHKKKSPAIEEDRARGQIVIA
jgi:hypothetical protein